MTTYRLYTINEADEIDEILRSTAEADVAAEVRRRWPHAVGCPNPGASMPQLWIWPSYEDYAEWFHANLTDFVAGADLRPAHSGPRMCAVVEAECPPEQTDSPFSIATWAPQAKEGVENMIRTLGGADRN